MRKSDAKTFTANLRKAGSHKPVNSGIFSNSGAGQKMDPKDYGAKGNAKLMKYAIGCNHELKTVKK